jgi:hypothetical protein
VKQVLVSLGSRNTDLKKFQIMNKRVDWIKKNCFKHMVSFRTSESVDQEIGNKQMFRSHVYI